MPFGRKQQNQTFKTKLQNSLRSWQPFQPVGRSDTWGLFLYPLFQVSKDKIEINLNLCSVTALNVHLTYATKNESSDSCFPWLACGFTAQCWNWWSWSFKCESGDIVQMAGKEIRFQFARPNKSFQKVIRSTCNCADPSRKSLFWQTCLRCINIGLNISRVFFATNVAFFHLFPAWVHVVHGLRSRSS